MDKNDKMNKKRKNWKKIEEKLYKIAKVDKSGQK